MNHQVCEIQSWRTVKRNLVTKECQFFTKWGNGEITIEPMSHFYNKKYYNKLMDTIVCDFITTAALSPLVKRKCLTCNARVYDGNVFCNRLNGIGKCLNLRNRYSNEK